METTMTQCPDKPTLQRYALGRTSEQLSDSVELHLADCRACDETLAMLDDTADSLLRHLPLAANEMRSPPELKQQPQWLQRLKGGPPEKRNQAPDAAEIKPPLQGLESYELLEVLGRGGMGVVYRGRHRQLDRNVAIKIVSPRLVTAGDAAQRFDREIAILGKLQHPGIVMATDAGRVRGAAYLVMELVDGCDLANLVRRQGPLAVSEACEVARQVAEALAAAHAAGAVHRDVKPSNVMLDRSGRSKLLDFGLARASDIQDHQRETSVGRLLGTLDYMAPEQASGNAVSDSADLFGLGATLFFLLTGRPPRSEYREQTVLQQLQSIANDDAPELQQLRADIPDELNSLVSRLLSRQPEDRPESASAVAEQLQAFADPAAVQAVASNLPADEPGQDDVVMAQSLSELLGDDILVGMSPAASTPAIPASNGRGGRRSIVRWLAGLGGIIAACYGIIFLLETPEGTLRIESESADIQIELLDENNLAQKLQIKGGEKETELRAGRYRIRLAGDHDAMTVSPQSIELTKNGVQVVRITYVKPKPDSVAKSDPNEPLYESLTRTVWQQRFHAESNPNAKIEAAKALVTLSRKLAVDEQVRLVMSIGSELLTDAEGVDWFESNVVIIHTRFVMLTNWNGNIYKDIRQQWDSLFQLMSLELALRAEGELADALTRVTKDGLAGDAAFAAMLLSDPKLRDHILADVQAGQTIIRSATSSTKTVDRALLLIRCDMADATDQHKLVMDDFNNAGRELIAAGAELINDRFPHEWLTYADKLNPDRTVWANVSFQMQLHNPQSCAPVSNNEVRRHWAISAVQWLKEHPLEDSHRTAALINQLRWHLLEVDSHSEWPLEEIRSLIVPRVEQRYLSTKATASQSQQKMATQCSMEDHLALLILAGGDLPDCTLARNPPAAAVEKFKILAECVKRNQTMKAFQKFCEDQKLAGLLADAPVETIRLLMERGPFAESPDMMWYFSTLAVLEDAAKKREGGFFTSLPTKSPVLSLLLIAISTRSSGTRNRLDDCICETLFCRSNAFPRTYDRGYILPTQRTKPAQDVAAKWLRKMQEKTSHKLLLTEIEEWIPGEKQKIRLAAQADPKSLEAALRTYNKETELLRLELFDPAIPDLTLQQFREALEAGEEECRAHGRSEIALHLRESIASGSLSDWLTFSVKKPSGEKENSPASCRQIAPTLAYLQPGFAGSGEKIPMTSLNLVCIRDGYASKTYGDIPPIDGTWDLMRAVQKNGIEISGDALTRLPKERQLIIAPNRIQFPFLESETKSFDLKLDYSARLPVMTASYPKELGGEIFFRGVVSGTVDEEELILVITPNGLGIPNSVNVSEEDNFRLEYKRVGSQPLVRNRKGTYLEVYSVKNTSADEVVKTLVALNLPGVTVVNEDVKAGTIHIMATAPLHEKVATLIRKLDGDDGSDESKNDTADPARSDTPPKQMQTKPTTSDTPKTQAEFPSSPEFPPVKIRVVDEDGNPVEGADVRLVQVRKNGEQPVVVTGMSIEDGLAIERVVPFGSYFISVRTAAGWGASRNNIGIEFGKAFNLTLVAPSPRKNAKVILEGKLNFSEDVKSNLRFGELNENQGSGKVGYWNSFTPEPKQPAESFASFPTMANGIDKVAFKILVRVKQDIPQADRSTLIWTWEANPQKPATRWLVSNDGVRLVTDLKVGRASPENESGNFVVDTDNGFWVGCHYLTASDTAAAPYSLEVPSGSVEILVMGIQGRPSAQALEALDLSPEDNREVWLPTNLQTTSDWIPKLLDTTGWGPHDSSQHLEHLLIRKLVVEPNETVNIKLMTP